MGLIALARKAFSSPKRIVVFFVAILAAVATYLVVNQLMNKEVKVVNEKGEILMTKTDFNDSSIIPSAELPQGYAISQDSPYRPEDTEDVVVTELVASGKPTIYVSQQPLPEAFDFNAFYQNISDLKEIDTTIGKAKYGISKEDKAWVASIQKDKDWVIVNGSSALLEADFVQAVKSLRR